MKHKSFLSFFILIILILGIFLGKYFYITYVCSTTVNARDNTFSITIPNRVKFKLKDSNEEDYLLDLYSVKDEMFLYSSSIDKLYPLDLNQVVSEDKNNMISNIKNVNIISDIYDFKINNYNACKYTYTYSDDEYAKDLYAEIVWIETDTKVYILDLEVITDNMEKYKTIFGIIENSFTEI